MVSVVPDLFCLDPSGNWDEVVSESATSAPEWHAFVVLRVYRNGYRSGTRLRTSSGLSLAVDAATSRLIQAGAGLRLSEA